MKRLAWAALAVAALAAAPGVGEAAAASEPAGTTPEAGRATFDAAGAWAEFAELLRLDYAYFQRPDVDGPKILAAFAGRAVAAKTRAEFIAIAKTVARNFADPHFNVGPGAATDPSTVPTASDLYADHVNGRCVIRDVRAGSDASAQGVRAGAVVEAIDGRAPAAAVEALLGQPLPALSRAQVVHGLNIALAGVRGQPRRLVLRTGASTRELVLQPTQQQANAVRTARALEVGRRGTIGVIRFNNSLGRNETIAEFQSALQGLADTKTLVIDLRNTPSGGNTTVARSVMGHFVSREKPYQVHVVPGEQRRWGAPRKFIELVSPTLPIYRGRVFVLGGRWTGSMGEGMMIGFDALGHHTAGSQLGHLLGAMFNETLALSGAQLELGEEQLFHVNGTAREAFKPRIFVEPAEARPDGDPTMAAVLRAARPGGADRPRR